MNDKKYGVNPPNTSKTRPPAPGGSQPLETIPVGFKDWLLYNLHVESKGVGVVRFQTLKEIYIQLYGEDPDFEFVEVKQQQVVEVFKVFKQVVEFFNGDRAKASKWFYKTTSKGFNDLTPFEVVINGKGDEVIAALERIEHGVFY